MSISVNEDRSSVCIEAIADSSLSEGKTYQRTIFAYSFFYVDKNVEMIARNRVSNDREVERHLKLSDLNDIQDSIK